MMKHYMDVFILKGREMTEEEEDALTLPLKILMRMENMFLFL